MRTKCRHDRSSWHYLGVPFTIQGWRWTNIGTNVCTSAQVGTISAYLSFSEGGFGQQLMKLTLCKGGFGRFVRSVGLLGGRFGPKSSQVGTIANGFGPRVNNTCTKIMQSGHSRCPTRGKWAPAGVELVLG